MITGIEKMENGVIDFNGKLKSFEEIFFDTDIVPNSRYRLVENTEKANPGYCNGILNEYEAQILREALCDVDPVSSSDILDLSVNTETVFKKNIENFDLRGIQSKRLIFNLGGNSFRGMSGGDSPEERNIQALLLSIMGIIERRIRNTTLIEFRIV
ncbi:MAG TPA: hypothetical protein PKI16_02025 [Candidatus Dojkabacteria bacterium]|nr:hypothetical protein [Candidatus Dojkabacteria bacterium]